MMKYATYKQMQALLQAKEAFKGNSVEAVKTSAGYYKIFSYETIVAVVAPCGKTVINVTKYSRTTSRIQHMLRLVFPDADLMDIVEPLSTYQTNRDVYAYAEHLQKVYEEQYKKTLGSLMTCNYRALAKKVKEV